MKKQTLREQLDESERNYRDLQAALLGLDLEKLQDEYVLRRNIEADIRQRQAEIEEVFAKLPNLLARRLAGLPTREISRGLDEGIRAAMIEAVRLSKAHDRQQAPTPPPGEGPQPKETP